MELLLDQHPALGTSWWVEANLETLHNRTQLRDSIKAHLDQFEVRYSRFRTDSLIGRLNYERSLPHPDSDLQRILHFGQSLYTRSHGTFNVLLGDTLTSRGYGKKRPGTTEEVTPHDTRLPDPTTDLIITSEQVSLRHGSVDLGGFGKGYVIDELAQILQAHHVNDFLINGGGDLYATSDHGTPITIYLEHPLQPGSYLGTITLFHQGFAASSPFKRTWKQGDAVYNHIVGVTDAASFVVANTARDADAFATAALLLPETAIISSATTEQFGIARFTPSDNLLLQHRLAVSACTTE